MFHYCVHKRLPQVKRKHLPNLLSDLTKWCKPTWEAIGGKIWHSHSGTDEESFSEMWSFVTGHVVTHVLKALQSSTTGTTCTTTHHITSHYSRFEANEIDTFSAKYTKVHVWNSPCSAFSSSDCRYIICCLISMVSFWISVGTNRLRVSCKTIDVWSTQSKKLTQFLLQRIFPLSPVKCNTTCHYLCAFYILCVLNK